MKTQTKTLKLTLEALELVQWTNNPQVSKAIIAIKEALADHTEDNLQMVAPVQQEQGEPDYKTLAIQLQQQRAWVGLTDEEYKELHLQMGAVYFYQNYGRAIEAKLKEKNNAK